MGIDRLRGGPAVRAEPAGNDRGLQAGSDEADVVAVNALNERTNATPAISDGEIFLRTHRHLVCIGEQSR